VYLIVESSKCITEDFLKRFTFGKIDFSPPNDYKWKIKDKKVKDN
jgi:hypothetical protein